MRRCFSGSSTQIACLACVAVFAGTAVALAQPSPSPEPSPSSEHVIPPGVAAPSTTPIPPPPPEETVSTPEGSPQSSPEKSEEKPDQADAKTPSPPKEIEFIARSFQISGLAVFQSNGNSFSPEIGWVPRIAFNDRLAIKLALDGAVLKGVGSNLVSVDYQAFLSWGPEEVKLDIGGGGETWFSQGTSPIGTAQVEIGLGSRPFLVVFDRLILGYSFYPVPNRATHEVTIGGGIEF